MSHKWALSKALRAQRIGGWICERCGKSISPRSAVGHHRQFRMYGGDDSVENCLLTCLQCERSFPHTRENSEGGTDVGKRSVRSRRNRGGASERATTLQDTRVEAIEPRVDGNLRNVAVLQYRLVGARNLDLTRLGDHSVQLSLDADNNLCVAISLEVS